MVSRDHLWCRRPLFFWLLLLVWLSFRPVEAMEIGKCEAPTLFASAVNVVILPYTYAEATDRQLSDAASNISLLIQFDTLGSARYGSLGVVNLRGSREACSIERILPRLHEWPAYNGPLGRGAGIIALWGRFFEDRGNIYVQSFVSFLRRNETNDVHLHWQSAGKPFDFTAALPTDRIAFAPRRIPRSSIEVINHKFVDANVVRTKPDARAPPLLPNLSAQTGAAFGIVSYHDDWLQLRPLAGGPDGFVRLGGDLGTVLKETLPELFFLDGLIGYLTYRAKLDHPDQFKFRTPGRTLNLVISSMDRYRAAINPAREPMAAALSLVIPGMLALQAAERGGISAAEALKLARERTKVAAQLAPAEAEIINLDAIVRIRACCATGPVEPDAKAIDTALYGALAVAPQNRHVLSTLRNFYEILKASSSGPVPQDQLEKRLAAVRALQESLGSAP